ncbi:hypothetical protein [Pseudogulbenkiania sp. MAI-1]|nr:hypothetical protein [Pseudogulbenkiania sp. MAI-1]
MLMQSALTIITFAITAHETVQAYCSITSRSWCGGWNAEHRKTVYVE